MSTGRLNAFSDGRKLIVNLNLKTGYAGNLVIRNVLGQEIYKSTLNGYGNHEMELPDADGIYVLSFYSVNGVFSKKIFLSKER